MKEGELKKGVIHCVINLVVKVGFGWLQIFQIEKRAKEGDWPSGPVTLVRGGVCMVRVRRGRWHAAEQQQQRWSEQH